MISRKDGGSGMGGNYLAACVWIHTTAETCNGHRNKDKSGNERGTLWSVLTSGHVSGIAEARPGFSIFFNGA